ncbi:MAG: hypothetical protein NT051_00140 [Candidatus Micrarchaeota archaeon]|nr:hypothetical protein [Candidatus Micrarchaeota archaeon]
MMGITGKYVDYQITSQQMVGDEECGASEWMNAFALGNKALVFSQPEKNATVRAVFQGEGWVRTVKISHQEGVGVGFVGIGDQRVCGPCNETAREYALATPLEGNFEIQVKTFPKNRSESEDNISKLAFFDASRRIYLNPQVNFEFGGGWKSLENAQMPSSYYGVDAPFHMHRVGQLAPYLLRGEWPWSFYSFFSALPPAIMTLAFGFGHEYSYKIYSILLFFTPVLIFFLFSRKLPACKNTTFVLSALLYLTIPSTGMPIGSGIDLFYLGMTAHTLATYLSLLFFYFAYGYLTEGGRRNFALAVLMFSFAGLSNWRILLPLSVALVVLGALALPMKRARPVALLALACAASVAWLLAPFLANQFGISGYGVLGGATLENGWVDSLVSFAQMGYLVLPLLFVIGIVEICRKKWLFPLVLAIASAMTYIVAVSPEINKLFPFVDGARLFPSFFLPAFFIAGVGSACLVARARKTAEKMRARLSMDRLTFWVSVALMIFLPACTVILIAGTVAAGQYAYPAGNLNLVAEYSSLQKAAGIINGGTVFVIGANSVSQWLIYDSLTDTAIPADSDQAGLQDKMGTVGAKYALFGNSEVTFDESAGFLEKFSRMRHDGNFTQIKYGGAVPLFELVGAKTKPLVRPGDARLDFAEIMPDRASLRGECLQQNCIVSFFSNSLPENAGCREADGKLCYIEHDQEAYAWNVALPKGEFDVKIAPKPPGFEFPLAVCCSLIAIGCALLSGGREVKVI